MKTPLAWLNLLHNKSRTAVAVAGVAFSVLLVFMQLGFLGAVGKTATMSYDGMDFDIVLRSPEYLYIIEPRTIPLERMQQAETVAGVASARPFYAAIHVWRHPTSGQTRAILCMGFRPDQNVFLVPGIRDQAVLLNRPNTLLIDRLTRREFGPVNGDKFSQDDIGTQPEIGHKRMSIVGTYQQGTGLACEGAVVMSERSYKRVFSGLFDNAVCLALIKVTPGVDVDEVAQRLRESLPPEEVLVLNRAETIKFEHDRWVHETAIGTIFKTGVIMALVVGVAIVYQVLSSDIEDQLPQYATLRAIGYSNRYLAGIVLTQGILLAALGFIPGWLVSQTLYLIIASVAYLPISMSLDRVVVVFLLALLMCAASGLAALRKVRAADPADLF